VSQSTCIFCLALALFPCSALMPTYYFATFGNPASLFFAPDPPGIPEWILPIQGCVTLIGQFSHQLRVVGMGGLLYDYRQAWFDAGFPAEIGEWDSQVQVLRTKLLAMNGTDPDTRSLAPLTQQQHISLRLLISTCRSPGTAQP
jgi:hypothetical protein